MLPQIQFLSLSLSWMLISKKVFKMFLKLLPPLALVVYSLAIHLRPGADPMMKFLHSTIMIECISLQKRN